MARTDLDSREESASQDLSSLEIVTIVAFSCRSSVNIGANVNGIEFWHGRNDLRLLPCDFGLRRQRLREKASDVHIKVTAA
jgi:hypothetical protein